MSAIVEGLSSALFVVVVGPLMISSTDMDECNDEDESDGWWCVECCLADEEMGAKASTLRHESVVITAPQIIELFFILQ